jgi:hypothetical protein
MSSDRSDEGIPRRRGGSLSTRKIGLSDDEVRQANEARNDKLRRNSLSRRARALKLELRHSAHGYSLIDASRDRLAGRNDLTLDDVESFLRR